MNPTELVPTPIALAAPVEKARTVGMRMMTGWTRNAIITSLTSLEELSNRTQREKREEGEKDEDKYAPHNDD